MGDMFAEVSKNKWKSYFLIFFFVLVISSMGAFLGYIWNNLYLGFGLAFIFAILYSVIVFNSGGSMILKSTGAREVKRSEYPYLWHSVEGLSIAAGMPKPPKVYVIDDPALNAFATGRDPEHASITVTTGLLEKMNRQELEGVIAHEMSHIKNYDIRFMMLTVVLVGVVVLLSNIFLRSLWFGSSDRRGGSRLSIIFVFVGLALAILSPIIVELIRLAISRKREYLADASGAILTRYPEGLASALEKIKNDSKPNLRTASKGTAALFISNPLRKKKEKTESSWWSTHPSLSDRIRRLREM